MTASLSTSLLLPIALGIIMFGLGLSLTVADFTRVLRFPKAVIVGLAAQMLLLPPVCLLIAHLFGLGPSLAVGLMLLAASPGGAVANLYSHLAHGDVALNITLTAVNSVLTVVTLPLIVNLSMLHFMGAGEALPLQFTKIMQVFVIVLGPVLAGMLVNRRAELFAARLRGPLKLISLILLVLVVGVAVLQNRDSIGGYIQVVGAACLAFNLVSLAVGYGIPRLLKLEHGQAVAIGMEVGIHNASLAIMVAMSPLLLNDAEMAVPAAVYGVLMFFTAAGFGWLVGRRPA